jgi:sugar lactone lactonase YvrE
MCAGAILLTAVDARAQNLFVADPGGDAIYEFTPGGAENVFRTASEPGALAFDSSGDLFATTYNSGDNTGDIIEFANDNGTLSTNYSFFATNDLLPGALAFNSNGYLFEADGDGDINEFTPDGALTNSLFFSGPLAFDSSDDLFVASSDGSAVLEDETNGSQITFVRGIEAPRGLTFDGAGNLYVSGDVHSNIYEVAPDGTTNLFATVPGHPNALRFDGAGDLFVVVDSGMNGTNVAIIEIAPGSTQSTFASGFNDQLQLANETFGLAFQPIPTLQAAAVNGTFQLTVTMPSPYYTAIVQASTNLLNWCSVCTNTPPFTFMDSPVAPSRFYRAVLDTNNF